MKSLRHVVGLASLALTCFVPVTAAAASPVARLRRVSDPVPGRYIVVLQEQAPGLAATGVRGVPGVAGELTQRHGGRVAHTYQHALRGYVVEGLSERQAERLAEEPAVKYVEQDGLVHADLTTQSPAPGWLDRIDQNFRPLDNRYSYVGDASGVHAYILDTGIRTTHSEFSGRASADFTVVQDGYGANDCNGHGTHAAGTVGGKTYGVARGVSLHSVRVLDCTGYGLVSGIVTGVDWVTAHHTKPAVANMSLGGGFSQSIEDAVRNSIAAGVTYVVAAGNRSTDACTQTPARMPEVITVGATDAADGMALFSNQGSCLDLFAPGVNITSAWASADDATATHSGTSMAAPHTTGVAALYLGMHRNATPAQVASAIVETATRDVVWGAAASNSPNRLLYSGFIGVQLTNGLTTSDSAPQGTERFFAIQVPAGMNALDITISGGTGDADLSVKHGALPTLMGYDCRAARTGNEEKCSFSNPTPGTWLIRVYGWRAYSDVKVRAVYSQALTSGVAKTGLSGSVFDERYFTLTVPTGAQTLSFSTAGGTGNVDLMVQYGAAPGDTYTCGSFNTGTSEACSFSNPAPGVWYVLLRGRFNFFTGSYYSNTALTGTFSP
jgi:serine protease